LLSDFNPPSQISLLIEHVPAIPVSSMETFDDPMRKSLETDWFYVLIHLDSAAHGYGSHSSLIFDAQGRHLTSNRQATTVFERDGGKPSLKSLPRRLAFRGSYNLFQLVFKLKGLLS